MSSNKKRRELNRAIEEHEIAKLASSSNNAFNAAVWEARAEKLQADNEQLRSKLAAIKADNATAWAQAHRLALELECLLLDTKDNAIVSKWWDSGMAALNEYQQLKPGAKEDAEAWAKMRKETP